MEFLQTFLSEQTVQRIGWVLVHFLWQGVAAAAVMWCVLKVLHKASANVRYVTACAGLMFMVAAPIGTYVLLGDHAPVAAAPVMAQPESVVIDRPAAETKTVVMAEFEPAALPEPSLTEVLAARLETALPYCVVGWAIGVAVLSVWFLGGWCQLQKLRRIGTKAVSQAVAAKTSELANRIGIRRAVGIVESALVQVPTVIGWLKPVVLLPATALTGLDEVQLRAMIAHELAHVKRCDYLVNIIQTVVEILGFYHPAVWWMSKQIRTERENACDDMAVALVQNKKQYAGALFTMEAIRTQQRNLAIAANGGHLTSRISRLAQKPETHQKSGWVPSIAIFLVAVLLITTSMATRQEPEASSQNAEEYTAAQSMQNLKQLGLAWFMYADNNDDDIARTLDELNPYLESEVYSWLAEHAVLLKVWVDFRDIRMPQKTPVAYDKTFLEQYGRRIVAFADGHVEIDQNDGLKELLDKAIRVSERIERTRPLKSLGVELWCWANDHDGVLPDSIEQVEFKDNEDVKVWAMENVEYLAAGKAFSDIKDTAKEVIAYDKNLSKTDNGTNLLFADGHVEFVEKDENGIVVLYPGGRKKTWEKAFNDVYRLNDGDILKRIAPPFISERKDFYYEHDPDQAAAIPDPPDYYSFRWDSELKSWGMSFGDGRGNSLAGVLTHSLSIPADQFEGPDELLKLRLPGDWVVRNGVTDAEKLRALEIILREEFDRKISFHKRKVTRPVIVAKGTYKLTPPRGTYNDRWVHLYSDVLDPDEGSGGGTADTVAELIAVLGQRTGLQVIDETKNSSEKINQPYGHHSSSRIFGVTGEGKQTDKLNLMLKNLEKQTNLTFTVEERTVSKWFVVDHSDGKPAVNKSVSGPYGDSAGGFGGGMMVAGPNEIINYPRNWDKILAEQNKKRGIDPNDYPPVGEINLSDPNQMVTALYDVADLLRPASNSKPGSNANEVIKHQMAELKQTIVKSIVPESWYVNGGKGLIKNHTETTLSVYQSLKMHRTLREYFTKLREELSKQIAIEARILLVTENFWEDIGLDMSLPSESETSGGVGEIVVGPANSKDVLAALEHKPLEERALPPLGTRTPRHQTLDDLQNKLILKTAATRTNAKQLTAPKAMVLNGESACMVVQTEWPYIDIDGKEKNVPNGLVLDIQPTMQDDSKEVLIKGHVQYSNILENDPETSEDIPYIQVANIPIHAVAEDTGTLLVPGPELTMTRIVEKKSRIPIVGQFFTNRSKVTDKQRLLILIKPTVIKQDEVEPDAIGALAPHPGE